MASYRVGETRAYYKVVIYTAIFWVPYRTGSLRFTVSNIVTRGSIDGSSFDH